MNILVISDSHGKFKRIQQALDMQIEKPRAVFFLGDGLRDLERVDFGNIPVESVCGNCDMFDNSGARSEILTTVGGVKFLLMHGHRYGVKSDIRAAALYAVSQGADVLLFGHTHTAYEEIYQKGEKLGSTVLEKPLYIFNPGSIGDDGCFGTVEIRDGKLMFGRGEI